MPSFDVRTSLFCGAHERHPVSKVVEPKPDRCCAPKPEMAYGVPCMREGDATIEPKGILLTERMRRHRTLPLMASAVLLMVVLAACGGDDPASSPPEGAESTEATGSTEEAGSTEAAAEPTELAPVTFAKVGESATLWPIYVAQSEGFCTDHGVEVTQVAAQSPAAVTQALAAGSADVGSTGIPDIVRPIDAGGPLKIVASGVEQPPYSVLVKPDISGWSDLVGQQVIVGGPQDITKYYFDTAAKANSLDPAQFTYTYAGSTANRYAALQSGSVAATILLPPFVATAEAAGYKNLGQVAQYLPDSPFTAVAANTDWAESNSQALEGFLACYVEGTQWLYDEANREAAITILAESTNTEPAAANDSYEYYINDLHAYSETGRMDVDNFATLLSALAEVGALTETSPAEEYIDNSYVEQATASG